MNIELLPKTYQSADFDKTPPEPHVIIPDKLIHEGVEAAGKQGDYSKERKHPVFFVDLPSKTISLTIGWLDPNQSSNMHRHTYETILNVLEGKMSFVGPRPHAVAHNEAYRKLISGYMIRHKVRPGITGWAQVNGLRGETSTVEMMQRRVQYDLDYLKNWSLWLDLKIIALTALTVIYDRNAY